MSTIKLNLENSGVYEKDILKYSQKVFDIHNKMNENADNNEEFLGWVNLPTKYDKKEFEKIRQAAQKIRKDSDVLVVIGIGGSYLGARAVI